MSDLQLLTQAVIQWSAQPIWRNYPVVGRLRYFLL
jgi:hypothetical protein